MELDFKNNFTLSLAAILFWLMVATASLWLFASIWAAAGFWTALFGFAVLGLILAWPAGVAFTVASFSLAVLISGICRLFRYSKQPGSTSSNTSL